MLRGQRSKPFLCHETQHWCVLRMTICGVHTLKGRTRSNHCIATWATKRDKFSRSAKKSCMWQPLTCCVSSCHECVKQRGRKYAAEASLRDADFDEIDEICLQESARLHSIRRGREASLTSISQTCRDGRMLDEAHSGAGHFHAHLAITLLKV